MEADVPELTMGAELTNSFLFKLLVSTDYRLRLARYTLLWGSGLYLIYRGFRYLATSISNPTPETALHYTLLATGLFGGLTVTAYWGMTTLVRQLILTRFRPDLFIGFVLLVHVVTSEIVLWHFGFFTRVLTLEGLPRFYARNADHIAQLRFWEAPFDSVIVWLFSFSLFYNYLLYTVGLKAFKDLFSLQLRQTELEKANLQLEFNFLKAQVNPHFLFNTLNNIYSFSIKSPTKVADSILKLADLMRYSLYETEEEVVLLAKELAFLDSYIQLERIRHETDVQITFDVEGNAGQLMIPPLLLIIFVENAFKHGIQASAQALWVRIEIRIEQSVLTFRVTNSLPAKPVKSIVGIGLNNVRKRLHYHFGDTHGLITEKRDSIFFVQLAIDLHEQRISGNYR